MDIFTCGACKYTFSSPLPPLRCPDCGKQRVRLASREEVEEYKRIRIEIAAEDEHATVDKLAANQ